MSPRDTTPLHDSIDDALRMHARTVLAVSGGLDSMVLLDVAADSIPRERLIVASFDHGTGPPARAACALVERAANAWGIACVTGR
ncbi:MAG TPA: ATP-binding protein, partial [Acidimicrobiia bacterium]|nr:ATP-binding protein [Acidimicrobiia bacterium]